MEDACDHYKMIYTLANKIEDISARSREEAASWTQRKDLPVIMTMEQAQHYVGNSTNIDDLYTAMYALQWHTIYANQSTYKLRLCDDLDELVRLMKDYTHKEHACHLAKVAKENPDF